MNKLHLFLFLFLLLVNLASASTRSGQCLADLHSLSVSLELYKSENSKYPEMDNWEQELLDKKLIIDWPLLDPWKNKFQYQFPGIHNKDSYDIYSLGKDGISKTGGNDKDDINNWNPDRTAFYKAYGYKTEGQLLCIYFMKVSFLVIGVYFICHKIFLAYKNLKKRNL